MVAQSSKFHSGCKEDAILFDIGPRADNLVNDAGTLGHDVAIQLSLFLL
jgi:metal-dependent hydrolase (beta-lactamase superfamily II)